MTYAELVANLQATLQTDEATFVAQIPDIVKSAESDIILNTQIPDLRKNSQGSLTTGNEYLSLPSDFVSQYSLAVVSGTNHVYLVNKEVDFMREVYPARTTTGTPRYYGVFDDDTFIVSPTPDANYVVELHYFYKPNSIVDDSTTWIGTNASNALLYGSLVHAYIFLKGDQDMMQYYRDEYLRALGNLQVITEGRLRKDTYRQMNTRTPT